MWVQVRRMLRLFSKTGGHELERIWKSAVVLAACSDASCVRKLYHSNLAECTGNILDNSDADNGESSSTQHDLDLLREDISGSGETCNVATQTNGPGSSFESSSSFASSPRFPSILSKGHSRKRQRLWHHSSERWCSNSSNISSHSGIRTYASLPAEATERPPQGFKAGGYDVSDFPPDKVSHWFCLLPPWVVISCVIPNLILWSQESSLGYPKIDILVLLLSWWSDIVLPLLYTSVLSACLCMLKTMRLQRLISIKECSGLWCCDSIHGLNYVCHAKIWTSWQ